MFRWRGGSGTDGPRMSDPKLIKEVIKKAELRDELYFQIVKATRCNPTVPGAMTPGRRIMNGM